MNCHRRYMGRFDRNRRLTNHCPAKLCERPVKLCKSTEYGLRTHADAERLVTDNILLAHHQTNQFLFNRDRLWIERMGGRDDFVQQALLGLVAASRKFDEENGAKFSTYAVTCIRSKLALWVDQQTLHLANGVPIREDHYTVGSMAILSFDELAYGDPDQDRAMGLAAPDDTPTIEPDERDRLRGVISRLPEMERRIIWGRFFDGLTLRELSELIGVTKERIRQVETVAMARLADRMGLTGTLKRLKREQKMIDRAARERWKQRQRNKETA